MTGQIRRLGASSSSYPATDGACGEFTTTATTPSTTTRQAARWQQQPITLIAMIVALLISQTSAFSGMSMMSSSYKPPVKSSVRKLRSSGRFSEHHRTSAGSSSSSPGSRSPTSKSAYAGALAAPQGLMAPQSPAIPQESFEKRMRHLVLGSPAAKPKEKSSTAVKRPANIVTVETLAEYKRVVADEADRIVAVRFHSPWCRACKAMAPAFYHLALQNPGTLFVDVPVKEGNANLHQGLGVPSLPYGHMYHPDDGLVEELRITKKLMPEFGEILKGYIQDLSDSRSTSSS